MVWGEKWWSHVIRRKVRVLRGIPTKPVFICGEMFDCRHPMGYGIIILIIWKRVLGRNGSDRSEPLHQADTFAGKRGDRY